jgi:hypothetical protein
MISLSIENIYKAHLHDFVVEKNIVEELNKLM